jgi:alpha-L-rhamnosidase
VYGGENSAAALKALSVSPDFDYTSPKGDTQVQFVHRELADRDIYFLDNRSDRDETVDASFSVTGKAPELWYVETSNSEAVSYKMDDGRTTVPLHFEPWGTVFVVFRKPATAASLTLPEPVQMQLATVEGPAACPSRRGRGAPASVTQDKLISWSDMRDKGVKYFSGTGTYSKTIPAQKSWFKPGAKLWIDLGDVKNLAEVSVNGKSLGVVWHAPYRVDVTGVLKPGANQMTIKVTNA